MKNKIWDKTCHFMIFLCVCAMDELLCAYSSMSSVTVIYLFFFLSKGSFTSDDAEALSH